MNRAPGASRRPAQTGMDAGEVLVSRFRMTQAGVASNAASEATPDFDTDGELRLIEHRPCPGRQSHRGQQLVEQLSGFLMQRPG